MKLSKKHRITLMNKLNECNESIAIAIEIIGKQDKK